MTTSIALDSEEALERAILALLEDLEWETVSAYHEVYGEAQATTASPYLGRDARGDVLLLPRLIAGQLDVSHLPIAIPSPP